MGAIVETTVEDIGRAAIVILLTIGYVGAVLLRVTIPEDYLHVYMLFVGLYFGSGAVNLSQAIRAVRTRRSR